MLCLRDIDVSNEDENQGDDPSDMNTEYLRQVSRGIEHADLGERSTLFLPGRLILQEHNELDGNIVHH